MAAKRFHRYGDTNTLDFLRRLPGVNVDTGGPRMRGLGAAGYTNTDQRRPQRQGFNLDQLSPSQIERIEVIKAAMADQSAQAIAGTINVILKETSRRSLSTLRVGMASGVDRPLGNLDIIHQRIRWSIQFVAAVFLFEWGPAAQHHRSKDGWFGWIVCKFPQQRVPAFQTAGAITLRRA